MAQDLTTQQLVEDARHGSREAFQALYEAFAPRIHNFLFRLTGSAEESEDLTQQTFLNALRQLKSLRDSNQLESWLFRIARNEVYQQFRRRKPEPLDDDDQDGIGGRLEDNRIHGSPEKQALNVELGREILGALDDLPLKLREVFVLAVVQELSYQQISEIVGRSVLSVKTDIYRARIAVKSQLEKYLVRKS
jgi:RNA polymerase sigma-70 factor, ECF subfamily